MRLMRTRPLTHRITIWSACSLSLLALMSALLSATMSIGATQMHRGTTSQASLLSGHGPAQVHPNASSCSGGGPGTQTFGNWADNEAVSAGCPRGVYREAQLQFSVPSLSTSISTGRLGIWTGVGGDDSVSSHNVLVQAGVVSSISNGRQYNESFWEIVNSDNYNAPYSLLPQNLPLCRLNTGDTVYMDVQSNLNNDGWDYFYISNSSAGCSAYCQLDTTGHRGNEGNCNGVRGITNYNSDSATGECVVEKLLGYPFAEYSGTGGEGYHNVDLQGCRINSNWINAQSHSFSNITPDGQFNGCPCDTSVGHLDNYGDFNVTWLAGN